jgi:hypothetical protein
LIRRRHKSISKELNSWVNSGLTVQGEHGPRDLLTKPVAPLEAMRIEVCKSWLKVRLQIIGVFF